MENTKKAAYNARKNEKNSLTVLQRIGLFFMNICKLPAKNGERRLIKNIISGKWEWTSGNNPLPTTLTSLHPTVLIPDLAKIKQEEKDTLNPKFFPLPNDPYRQNRFIFNFPNIKEYLVQDFKQISADQAILTVLLVFPDGDYDIVSELDKFSKISTDSRKRKLKKDAILKMLDPTGVAVNEITFKNVSISSVNYFTELSYSSEGLMFGQIIFNHEGVVKTL